MDNLTHSLTGVFLSRSGLNRLAPDTTVVLLLAANAPDIDVVSGIAGSAVLLHWHRGITHSLWLSPVLAIAAVLLVRAISREKRHWAGAFMAAWIGVLSHLLLDLTNNYGVHLLAPFSQRWFQWDICFVINPWIWMILLIALFAPLLGRILSSEMGEKSRNYPSRGWPVAALSLVLLFECALAVLHGRAVETLNSRLYDRNAPLRVGAFPTPLNPLVWDGLVETTDRYWVFEWNLKSDFDPGGGKSFFKSDPGSATPVLAKLPEFGSLIEFAQYPLWRVINDDNNSRYSMTDLRFGDPVAGTFTCSARMVDQVKQRSAVDERCDFSFSANFKKE